MKRPGSGGEERGGAGDRDLYDSQHLHTLHARRSHVKSISHTHTQPHTHTHLKLTIQSCNEHKALSEQHAPTHNHTRTQVWQVHFVFANPGSPSHNPQQIGPTFRRRYRCTIPCLALRKHGAMAGEIAWGINASPLFGKDASS